MYLVVRSLKLNNEKIVSWLITENLHDYRTTKFRKKTFLKSVESNLPLRRLAMQVTQTTWKLTSPKNAVKNTATVPTASSTNLMTNYSKNSKKLSRPSWNQTTPKKIAILSVASAGKHPLLPKILSLNVVSARDQSAQSIWSALNPG